MEKSKFEILEDKKTEKRTFKENTAFGNLQDRITELESRIEDIEGKK